MTLSAIPTSPQTARIEVTGLEPGENPTLILSAQSDGYSSRMEGTHAQPVGADGRFADEVGGHQQLPGSTANHWEVQVVHARGIACTNVTLP